MTTTTAGMLRLVSVQLFTILLFAIFRTKFFTKPLGMIFSFFKYHFADRTFLLKKIKHSLLIVNDCVPYTTGEYLIANKITSFPFLQSVFCGWNVFAGPDEVSVRNECVFFAHSPQVDFDLQALSAWFLWEFQFDGFYFSDRKSP